MRPSFLGHWIRTRRARRLSMFQRSSVIVGDCFALGKQWPTDHHLSGKSYGAKLGDPPIFVLAKRTFRGRPTLPSRKSETAALCLLSTVDGTDSPSDYSPSDNPHESRGGVFPRAAAVNGGQLSIYSILSDPSCPFLTSSTSCTPPPTFEASNHNGKKEILYGTYSGNTLRSAFFSPY